MAVVRVHDAVWRITTPFGPQDHVAFLYLVKGDSLALVDTGAADSPGRVLRPAFDSLGMSLSDVDLILNTHIHVDHSGGNMEVKQISGAPIYVHSDDVDRARSTEVNVEFAVAPFVALDLPPEMLRRRGEFTRNVGGEAAGADVVLRDGDVVELGAGIKLRVVHTPGHTPGCISYLWESEGILLTGDGIQGMGGDPGGYPFYVDAGAYRRSLDVVEGLDVRMLCMSHAYLGGGVINNPTRVGPDARAFVKDSKRVADTIHREVAAALDRTPGAKTRDIAVAALSELVYQIPQQLVRETGLPWFAPGTLAGHIHAAKEGSYPLGA